MQDEPPSWASDSDEFMGLESISEPDDMNMDLEDDDEDEGEQFFDSQSVSTSSASASGASGGRGNRSDKSKSDEVDVDVDTEDDPVDPITPGPNSRFSMIRLAPPGGGSKEGKGLEGDEEGYEETGDIEDDWVDPSLPSSPAADDAPESPVSQGAPTPRERGSSSGVDEEVLIVPSGSSGSLAKRKSGSGRVRKKGREGGLVISTSQEQHYPFPVADGTSSPEPHDRSRRSSTTNKGGKRMHTARARDGGRTQSGGVRGVLTED